jgi:hypothetical protein
LPLIDHHTANPLAWDLGFLALGAILVIAGVALAGRGRTRDPRPGGRATRARADVRRAA